MSEPVDIIRTKCKKYNFNKKVDLISFYNLMINLLVSVLVFIFLFEIYNLCVVLTFENLTFILALNK